MAWKNFREDTETSARKTRGPYKLKLHKPWFNEECLGFLDKNAVVT